MTATALLKMAAKPSVEQVRAALSGNICRCSNYNHYVAAVVGSAERSADAFITRAAALTTVGHSTPRVDAVDRCSGKAKYTGDVTMPGMLYGRVLRSPHPHARIVRIDASKARALPGVKAIITHENCKVQWGAGSIAGGQQYNEETKRITTHKRYAFNNPVRFAGEPVAAVAAVDRHTAEDALQLIAVEYETLPFVLDFEEALKPDAPKVWPDGNISPNNRNELLPQTQRRGDIAPASRPPSGVR